jgi:hypothetical protein
MEVGRLQQHFAGRGGHAQQHFAKADYVWFHADDCAKGSRVGQVQKPLTAEMKSASGMRRAAGRHGRLARIVQGVGDFSN